MKITDKNNLNEIRKGGQSRTQKERNSGLMSLFSSELNLKASAATDKYDQDIEELKIALENAGKKLENEPTINNFKIFRELLSKLAKQVSSEAYRLEKIGGTPMNPRYYEIITVINKEADKLYALVVKEQKDRMAITASVIGIKGLVVDLIT